VKNDGQHLVWNPNDKSITIKTSAKMIIIKANSTTALVNNVEITMEEAPVLYKDTLYIPMGFIAKELDRVAITDTLSKTVYIRDKKSFEKTKSILDNIIKCQSNCRKFKFEIKQGLDDTQVAYGEIDREKQKMHFFSPIEFNPEKVEYNIDKDTVYFRSGSQNCPLSLEQGKKWACFKIKPGRLSDSFNIPLSNSDAYCAGLTLAETKNELLLEGDIYVDEFYKRPNTYYDLALYNDIRSAHVRFTFDKKTNFMLSGVMDISYNSIYKKELQKDRLSFNYSQHNSKSINISYSDATEKYAEVWDMPLIISSFAYFELNK
jgi:hypothetical protein